MGCPDQSGGVSADQKQGLAAALQELSKATSQGAKMVAAGETSLARTSSIKEGELLEVNLQHLRSAAEEAEEVLQIIGIC